MSTPARSSSYHPLGPEQTEIILDSLAAGILTVDLEGRITSFNKAAEEMTGVPREEALGRDCSEVLRSSLCGDDCPIRQARSTGVSVVNKLAYIVDVHGTRMPVSLTAADLLEGGRLVGGVESFRDLRLVEELRKKVEQSYSFEDILSRNHRMREIFELVPTIAESDSTVLIEGETGTGKELVARAIHNLSDRGSRPFVAVNCGALQDTLLESELFGYEAGAFTDAKRRKIGRFARAEGGTLFLDEIGDVSAALQVRLLRVLQEREYEPLGAVKTEKTDVRILTATNKKLEALVKGGTFRDDLYYRIDVVRLSLPPLRERKEDIPLLVDHFMGRFNRVQNKSISGVSDEVMHLLMDYDYPGNVRELENVIEHAFVLCRDGIIEAKVLPRSVNAGVTSGDEMPSRGRSLAEMEEFTIVDALHRNDWNRIAAARELGIHKSTLFRKIKDYDISLPEKDGRSPRKDPKQSRVADPD
jgi:PAS domain S-box-containing protein